MYMRYVLIVLIILFGCTTPKLIVKEVYDDNAGQKYIENCMSKHDISNSTTAKQYWYDMCFQDAQRTCLKLDSIVEYKNKIYNFNDCPNRIKNRIENIIR